MGTIEPRRPWTPDVRRLREVRESYDAGIARRDSREVEFYDDDEDEPRETFNTHVLHDPRSSRNGDTHYHSTNIPPEHRAVRARRVGGRFLAYESENTDELQPLMTHVPETVRAWSGVYVLMLRLILITMGAVILFVIGAKILVWVW